MTLYEELRKKLADIIADIDAVERRQDELEDERDEIESRLISVNDELDELYALQRFTESDLAKVQQEHLSHYRRVLLPLWNDSSKVYEVWLPPIGKGSDELLIKES